MQCRAPWQYAAVGLDGNVSFCCNQRILGAPLIIGNLYLQTMEEIVNSPLAVAIREQMENELLPEACSACPLYEIERKHLAELEEEYREILASEAAPEEWLETAYAALLGRPADRDGREFFLGKLAEGKSRLWIVNAVSKSDEYRSRRQE